MTNRLVIIILLGFTFPLFAQDNYLGKYYQLTSVSYSVDLKPNNICIIGYPIGCTGTGRPSDTTSWSNNGDTIYIKTNEIYFKTFLYLSGSLYNLRYSDSIIPTNIFNRRSDHYFIAYPAFEKTKAYYPDGSIYTEIERYQEKKLEIFYYQSGRLKELREYSKIERENEVNNNYFPSGDWYEFWEYGGIKNHIIYKNGKILKKKQ